MSAAGIAKGVGIFFCIFVLPWVLIWVGVRVDDWLNGGPPPDPDAEVICWVEDDELSLSYIENARSLMPDDRAIVVACPD